MKPHSLIIRLALVALAFAMSLSTARAQDGTNQWLRVFTEEESVIEVDRLSLVLEQNQIIRAQFRTLLSRPEPVPGKSGVKFQTRLDSIHFSIKDHHYRISESNLLDASGKVVLSYSSRGTNGWKPLWGRTGRRLFNAASQLQPFGIWTVVSYRYASGDLASVDDPQELKSLVGSEILFKLDRVIVGRKECSAPVFDPTTITNEEFIKRTGSPFISLGVHADKIDAVFVGCRAKDTFQSLPTLRVSQPNADKPPGEGIRILKSDFPSQTMILRLPGNKSRMLWEGVFLEIERTRNLFLP